MAATTSWISRLPLARPAAMASRPASPSATLPGRTGPSTASAFIAATSTRPGRRVNTSHSVASNDGVMVDLLANRCGMTASQRQHRRGDRSGRRLRFREARLLRSGVLLLGDHDPAPEHADQGAVLLVALGLHADDATVGLGAGLALVQDGGLAVDGVAVEGRRDVAQGLDLEVGDGLAGHVRDGHAEQDRVDVVADHHVLLELRRRLGVVRVDVQRVVVHRQQAEEVVVVLGYGLARPVPVDRADLELLVVTAELHGPDITVR